MKQPLIHMVVASAVAALLVGVAVSDEPSPDRLRAEASELREKAEARKAEGKLDAARELEEKGLRLAREAAALAAGQRPADPERREAAERRERAEREVAEQRERVELERREAMERREAAERRELAEREAAEPQIAEKREHERAMIIAEMEAIEKRVGGFKEKVHGEHPVLKQMEDRLAQLNQRLKQLEAPPHPPRPTGPPRDQMRRHVAELKERVDDLRRAGKHGTHVEAKRDFRAVVERLKQAEGPHEPPPPHAPRPPRLGPEGEPEHRTHLVGEAIRQMHEAADKLHAAGLHEQAEQLHQGAQGLEAELHKHVQGQEIGRAVQELREEVGRLRHDLEALRRQVDRLSGHKRD